jgi:hypothetical protein
MVLVVCVAVTATACGPGASTGDDRTGGPKAAQADNTMPTPDEARSTVYRLWNAREDAMSSFQVTNLPAFESGALLGYDNGFLQYVVCGCEQPVAGHTILRVITLVPRSAPHVAYLAEVFTRNEATGERVWYVLGVRQDADETWKLDFLSLGTAGDQPPLRVPLDADGYAPPVSAGMERDLARDDMRFIAGAFRVSPVHRTSWGADVGQRVSVHPAVDGVYGWDMANLVVVCGTVHSTDRYTTSHGSLAQDDGKHNWGPLLEPGLYQSITVEHTRSLCSDVTHMAADYGLQDIAVTASNGSTL